MSAVNVNKINFAAMVLKSEKPVLVDFWASWCGPCRMLSPVVEAVAAEHPELAVAKVNVDEEPELAQQYGISAIPALMLFKDGKLVKQAVGYQSKEGVEGMLR